MQLCERLAELVRACFAAIVIESQEHSDALTEIAGLCREQKWNLATWDIDAGLTVGGRTSEAAADPLTVLKASHPQSGGGDVPMLIVLQNYHRYLNSPEIIQTLHRRIIEGRQDRTVFVLLSPSVALPPELEKLFTVVSHPLPDRSQLMEIASGVATEDSELPEGTKLDHLLDAAAGLTRLEAENAFALSLVRDGRLRADTVWERKLETVNRGGLLSITRNTSGFDCLGGLEALKAFAKRSLITHSRSGLSPRGVLLLGSPGVGKSAWCSALGAEVGLPTVRLDFGSLMGSLVGQSEQNLKSAFEVIDALGGCVLLIEELEKTLSGTSHSGRTDSGVGTRMLGSLLTWLEDQSSAYVVASANDIRTLPPELTRAGRFDAVFFLDLPGEATRRAIWELYLERYELGSSQPLPEHDGWTGAEIESCCRLSRLLDLPLAEAARNIVPISVTAAESITELREWASGRCLDAESGGLYRAKPSRDARSRRSVVKPSNN